MLIGKVHLILVFSMLLCHLNLQGQDKKAKSIPLFYEKVYLHTDRDTYTPGEDIWFKAYITNAQNNKLINNSHNLYVELINVRSKIVIRQVIRVDSGLGKGDFKLRDAIAAGDYRIRAYTNWMRNFGDNFVFEKGIRVVFANIADVKNVPKTAVKAQTKRRAVNDVKATAEPPLPMISFFAEGGSLVNDVRSAVGVKADNGTGKGMPVTGEVYSTSGRVVAKFTCDSLGMGLFYLTPDGTQEYHAEVKINGETQTFKIGKALHKGFVLSVSTTADAIAAEINCNGFALSDYASSYIVIEARHGNKIYFKQRVPVMSTSVLVQIPADKLPEGVACVTLYDEHNKPLNERLVYVHQQNNPKLTISTDKDLYQSKEKTTVKLKLTDSTQASLSLAVVDAGIVPVQNESIVLT